MTDTLIAAAMTPDARKAGQEFAEELIFATLEAIRQDPRAHGFVTLRAHEARVTELLAANNREVERRRDAEARTEAATALMTDVLTGQACTGSWKAEVNAGLLGKLGPAAPKTAERCERCHFAAAAGESCMLQPCPVMDSRRAASAA